MLKQTIVINPGRMEGLSRYLSITASNGGILANKKQ
jgi:hypothetical protein